MAFCLNMKSDYSFLSSTITFADAISYCKSNKSNYLSLIDTNLSGAIEFYNTCLVNKIKPIIGISLNVNYNGYVFPIVFICKTERGYKNISRLFSIANNYQQTSIDFKNLSLYSEDIVVILSSYDSYLAHLIENNMIFEANEFVDDIKSTFKEYYLGVYRYKGINKEKIDNLKEYANNVQLKSIAFQYAFHIDEKDTLIVNLLDCIKKSTSANKDFLANNAIVEAYLKNDEQLKIYYDVDELDNLMILANSINLKLNKVDYSLPIVFKGENPDEKLKELALNGLNRLKLDNQKYIDRMEYELQVISKMGFSNYYLVVSDYVNYAKNNGILVGPSRGSGGASLIAYLLNITTIDPLKFDLLFERFLNPSRTNYPDFDIDFADIKREDVIEYVKNKYGYKKVAYISTFSYFGVKSAIRDVARLLKISNDEVDTITKTLSANPISINYEYNHNEKFKSLLDIHGNYKTLCSLASKIEGLKKQIGLHAAGIILSEQNIDEIVPTYHHSNNSLAIAYDYKNAENVGLIKMDFLGLKNLSIIEYCIDKINKKYCLNYTIDTIPYDDKNVYSLISNGYTFGLFQLESEGMNNFIKKLQPNCFEDIVALLALYRPGPMDMIDIYIDRKHGKSFEYIDNSLNDILAPTYGIIIYQEQIMQIVQKVALFTLAEADIFRRAISKKDQALLLKQKQKFIDGCIVNGFNEDKAFTLYNLIEKFASYGFNKAHSVGYGKITTIMGYLKSNYPEIFYEALLNVNNENNERRKKLFNEARKMGISILKPDVNTSLICFESDNKSIQYGLSNIKTIKDNIASVILNNREIAPFEDIYDFVIRMVNADISLQVLTDLNFAGALDCFNVKRSVINANINALYQYALMFKGLEYKPNSYKEYLSIQTPLLVFEDEETDFIKKEFEMLNYYISLHPIKRIKNKLNAQIIDLDNIDEDNQYNVVCKITNIELFKSKDNKDVITLTLEDETSLIKARSYFDAIKIKETYKKGNVVFANISRKNSYFYLNTIKKLED